MRSNILRGSFVPGPPSGVPPPRDGLCWHKRGFTVEGRRVPVESWFTVILWSSLSSLFNLPNCIHFESWRWNFLMSVSCVSPLSFLTIVAFLILGQLLGPYVVCHPIRCKMSPMTWFCFKVSLPAQCWTQGPMQDRHHHWGTYCRSLLFLLRLASLCCLGRTDPVVQAGHEVPSSLVTGPPHSSGLNLILILA